MRTTGIRSVPSPAPRSQVAAGSQPLPLPRTKFNITTAPTDTPPFPSSPTIQGIPVNNTKNTNVSSEIEPENSVLEQNETNKTLQSKDGDGEESIISSPSKFQSELTRASLHRKPVRKAPPKPPRTFSHQVTLAQESAERDRMSGFLNYKVPEQLIAPKPAPIPSRPKLIDILYRPSPSQKAASDSKANRRFISNTDWKKTQITVSEAAPGKMATSLVVGSLPSRGDQVSNVTFQATSRKTLPRQSNASESGRGSVVTQSFSRHDVGARRSINKMSNTRGVPFPPPAMPPPSVPSSAPRPCVQPMGYSRPEIPTRPTAAQLAPYLGNKKANWPRDRVPGSLGIPSRSQTTASSSVRVVDQDPVCTPADFEDNCKEVFKCIRAAKEHIGHGRHIQAVSQYQAALTAIDRVLKAQVLSITSDEHTRQRFFQLQQEVFVARKETLNGFSDAQAAVKPTPGLSTDTPAPGAPPTYDDVLREDQTRSRDKVSGVPARQPLQQHGSARVSYHDGSPNIPCHLGSSAVPRSSQLEQGRPRRSAKPHTVALASGPPLSMPQPPWVTRVKSSSLRARPDDVVLVDTSGEPPSGTPLSAPVNFTLRPLVPTKVSPPRSKSYHRTQEQPIPVALDKHTEKIATYAKSSQPNKASSLKTSQPNEPSYSKFSQPNEAPCPKSSQPDDNASYPTSSHTSTETQVRKPRTSSTVNETPIIDPVFSPPFDEALFRQAQALEKFEEQRKREVPAVAVKAATTEPLVTGSLGDRGLVSESSNRRTDSSKDDGINTSPSGVGSVVCAENNLGSETSPPSASTNSTFINDPFMNIDPFPPVDPNTVITDPVFTEDIQSSSPLVFSDDPPLNLGIDSDKDSVNKRNSTKMAVKPLVVAGGVKPSGNAASPVDIGQAGAASLDLPHDTEDNTSYDEERNSILEALDFAITPTPNHKKVSPQNSKVSIRSRCYSEYMLLDCSYGTLNTYIEASKEVCAKRASIIEEFDPLMSHSQETKSPIVFSDDNVNNENAVETRVEENKVNNIDFEQLKTVNKPRNNGKLEDLNKKTQQKKEESEVLFPRVFNEEGAVGVSADLHDGAVGVSADLHDGAVGVSADLHDGKGAEGIPDNLYNSEEPTPSYFNNADTKTSVSSSTGSCTSWPSDFTKNSSWPSSPVTPPSEVEMESQWYSDEEEPKVLPTKDVGRSTFHRLSTHQDGDDRAETMGGIRSLGGFRDLLRIREGVKIFFIHTDGVVTSPWNKPFLAASKDTNMIWRVGEGVVLRVGKKLWSCNLHSKTTLVLRSSGIYIFKEVPGKPECKAVGIKVPARVRKAQHELLGHILRENTRIEDERPSGITNGKFTP
nr:uncharacterized protein LOC128691889 [Cherax quadricarinatus]